jgi:hypothetical protein
MSTYVGKLLPDPACGVVKEQVPTVHVRSYLLPTITTLRCQEQRTGIIRGIREPKYETVYHVKPDLNSGANLCIKCDLALLTIPALLRSAPRLASKAFIAN